MTTAPATTAAVRTIGRYALFDEIAAGGMATVHLGRLIGPVGFSRTVAIKRLHSHFAKDPEFSAGFVDEARLAARIHHPNVVPIIDVLADEGELSLVMDYVEGDSLAKLLRHATALGERIPLNIISSIICGSLYGLHAAHEAVDERGEPMHIVHRDVSPQNILVGSDGVPRIVDFGVAKAAQRLQTTAEGQVKGKVAYMAPEQIRLAEVHRQTDVYAVGVVLWESIAQQRLFTSDNPANLMRKVLEEQLQPPSKFREDCPPELDQVVMRALSRDISERYQTARAMAQALQAAVAPAPPTDVSDWVLNIAQGGLTERRKLRARVESFDFTNSAFRVEEELRSSPIHEDVPTIMDRKQPGQTEDSTQAVTGTAIQTENDRGRLILPLALGLATVAAAILVVLFSHDPKVDDGAGQLVPQPTLAPTSPAAPSGTAQAPAPATQPAEEPSSTAPSEANQVDDATAPAPASSASTSTTTSKSTNSATTTTTRPPTRPTTTSTTDCPKFIEGADGIRRVNRKCWK